MSEMNKFDDFKQLTITIDVDGNKLPHTVMLSGDTTRHLYEKFKGEALDESLNLITAEVKSQIKRHLFKDKMP